jgi:hypothetical protein
MAKKVETQQEKSLKRALLEQLLALCTSGFGLVAALAWNETIQGFVKEFIEPRIPGSGLFYKFIYAVIVTCFAVFITYQLSKVASRIGTNK